MFSSLFRMKSPRSNSSCITLNVDFETLYVEFDAGYAGVITGITWSLSRRFTLHLLNYISRNESTTGFQTLKPNGPSVFTRFRVTGWRCQSHCLYICTQVKKCWMNHSLWKIWIWFCWAEHSDITGIYEQSSTPRQFPQENLLHYNIHRALVDTLTSNQKIKMRTSCP